MVRGKKVGYSCDQSNNALDKALGSTDAYEGLATTLSLYDLKGRLAPLIFYTTPRWIETGSPIEKKNLNIVAWYWFSFLNITNMSSQKNSIIRHPKEACLGSIISRSSIEIGLIIE